MYKSHSAEDYKKYFGLPKNYKIDAILVSGTFSQKLELANLQKVLGLLGQPYKLNHLPITEEHGSEFFGAIKELRTE